MRTAFTPAQLADPHLKDAEHALRTCIHCGFCTATCPTYVLLGDERSLGHDVGLAAKDLHGVRRLDGWVVAQIAHRPRAQPKQALGADQLGRRQACAQLERNAAKWHLTHRRHRREDPAIPQFVWSDLHRAPSSTALTPTPNLPRL